MKKETLTKGTKYFLDFMFVGGIVATATLPISLKIIGQFLPRVEEHYKEAVVIYFVLGIAAVVIIRELRKMFQTVLNKNCFVYENVVSLQKMGKWSFFIVLMSLVRTFVYMTMAMGVVILVFTVAGLFSLVLSFVFEEAVGFKEENDLTV
ncbi:MAG: DUF2975 domain-containing protein [Lachnospiraceae bacterium]|nr:DUF2975 domain-containing protein [Lachnospiraceae bacterium]